MNIRDLDCRWHDYFVICSDNVTGTDFENSQYSFGQSEKSSMYIDTKNCRAQKCKASF